MSLKLIFVLLSCLFQTPTIKVTSSYEPASAIRIPIGGNTFLTAGTGEDKITSEGITAWRSVESVFSTFLRLEEARPTHLQLELGQQQQSSEIEVSVGRQIRRVSITEGGEQTIDVGVFDLPAGYGPVILKGYGKQGDHFAQVKAIVLNDIDGKNLKANFVRDNIDNRFYWGRRGPSVHLSYELPVDKNKDYQWFYSELTVPVGEDPNGSYYMANGFAEGYFGIQANSETERRVLFSVWSPFITDNPSEIPEGQRIKLLEKGEGVNTGEFGNEGSGGQSFLRYPWITGNTYRFLNSVTPDGKGNTIYTAYFYAPEIGNWQLIASFLRPKTDTWYKRPHSFLENFIDSNGYKERKAYYSNQWIRDSEGNWLELDKARFSTDDIGQRNYRMDFAGGEKDGRFFLKNGGFFNDFTMPGRTFQRDKKTVRPPINFEELE